MEASKALSVDVGPDRNEIAELPIEHSVGYQIRNTHRLIQRALQTRIEPHGVTLGMWYLLRVLWIQDGVTQSDLSRQIGTMEPTTLAAVRDMERAGFVRRARDPADGRKINVYLTTRGRALKPVLVPLATEVVETAMSGMSQREISMMLELLACMQHNLRE